MIGRAALVFEVNHSTTETLAKICTDLHVCEYFLFHKTYYTSVKMSFGVSKVCFGFVDYE